MHTTIIKLEPNKMLDFLQGHVLLAYRNTLIYMDVSDTLICQNNEISTEVHT